MSITITGDWSDTDLPDADGAQYRLRLYIAGASSNSTRAIENTKAICETYLSGRYELEIIDVHNDSQTAEQERIIALPMLLRMTPEPERRLIGDMSNTEKVLRGLGLK